MWRDPRRHTTKAPHTFACLSHPHRTTPTSPPFAHQSSTSHINPPPRVSQGLVHCTHTLPMSMNPPPGRPPEPDSGESSDEEASVLTHRGSPSAPPAPPALDHHPDHSTPSVSSSWSSSSDAILEAWTVPPPPARDQSLQGPHPPHLPTNRPQGPRSPVGGLLTLGKPTASLQALQHCPHLPQPPGTPETPMLRALAPSPPTGSPPTSRMTGQ